jgi:hypothetical protein
MICKEDPSQSVSVFIAGRLRASVTKIRGDDGEMRLFLFIGLLCGKERLTSVSPAAVNINSVAFLQTVNNFKVGG